nr:reverse transcriptase domain-containing protein [Tanacetum cinerariifolium]
MRTRSQSRNKFPQQEASPAIVEPLHIELLFLKDQFQEDPPEDPPEVSMADNRTMAELLQAPTESYEDAIIIPEIAANNFELKHARIWLEKEPPRSILTWDDLVTKFINQFFPPSKTTNLHNEITRFQQRFDESFYEAWDRFNDLLRACPHHGFSELHQLDTLYNSLNVNDQDSLNSAAGGNFLDKISQECLKIIESKSKVHQSRAKAVVAKVSTSSSTSAISSEVAELKDMVRALLLDKKNQSSAPISSPTPAPVKAAPTEGYEDEIVIPEIAANNFELKNGLINLVQNKQFFGHDKEDPHAHIRFIELRCGWKFLGQNAPRMLENYREQVQSSSIPSQGSRCQTPAHSPTPAPVKAVEPIVLLAMVPTRTKIVLLPAEMFIETTSKRPTIPTPSKVVKQGTDVTKDQVQTPSSQSTAPVQPPVIQSETQTPISEPVVAP